MAHGLIGHGLFWNGPELHTLWRQYVTGESKVLKQPSTSFSGSTIDKITLGSDGVPVQSTGRAETLFTGLPRPVCDFYDYNSVDYPRRPRLGGGYIWFNVKAVRYATESPGLCTPGLRARRAGVGLGLGVLHVHRDGRC